MDILLLLEVVVAEVIIVVIQIRPDEPSNILSLSAAEVIHVPQRVCENDGASENILTILATLDTSHLEMSLLNDDAE